MFNSQDSKPKGAKQALDLDKAHQRRQMSGISIRKDKRNEMLEKKRRADGDDNVTNEASIESLDPMQFDQNTNPSKIPVAFLPKFVEMIHSSDPSYIFHGTVMIRKILSVEHAAPIAAVIETGAVLRFTEFLGYSEMPQLQFEACWALTNIASGTPAQTEIVVGSGAVPKLVQLLESPNEACREQAAWAIGNIAGEGQRLRDICIQCNAINGVLKLLDTENKESSTVRNGVWSLSNLCRGKPPPLLEAVEVALPALAWLMNYSDEEVVVDATWAISYISDGSQDRINAVLHAGVLPRVIELLSAPSPTMLIPAIRTVGNFVAGNDEQTQAVINAGALAPMHLLLQNPKRAIRKEACWAVSNICAGRVHQIQACINANLIPQVLLCTAASELDVKKESAWVLSNIAIGGTKEQVSYLVEVGALEAVCAFLEICDPKIVIVALETLGNILATGNEIPSEGARNPWAERVASIGGVETLENLQGHLNSDIYSQALKILETYFEVDSVVPGGNGGMNFTMDNEGMQNHNAFEF